MDVTILERMIAVAIASLVRAQQLAAPTLDRCVPGMVGDAETRSLNASSRDLALAGVYCRAAADALFEASKTLSAFTRGPE